MLRVCCVDVFGENFSVSLRLKAKENLNCRRDALFDILIIASNGASALAVLIHFERLIATFGGFVLCFL